MNHNNGVFAPIVIVVVTTVFVAVDAANVIVALTIINVNFCLNRRNIIININCSYFYFSVQFFSLNLSINSIVLLLLSLVFCRIYFFSSQKFYLKSIYYFTCEGGITHFWYFFGLLSFEQYFSVAGQLLVIAAISCCSCCIRCCC